MEALSGHLILKQLAREAGEVIQQADKTSNLLAIAKSPPPWPLERKRLPGGAETHLKT